MTDQQPAHHSMSIVPGLSEDQLQQGLTVSIGMLFDALLEEYAFDAKLARIRQDQVDQWIEAIVEAGYLPMPGPVSNSGAENDTFASSVEWLLYCLANDDTVCGSVEEAFEKGVRHTFIQLLANGWPEPAPDVVADSQIEHIQGSTIIAYDEILPLAVERNRSRLEQQALEANTAPSIDQERKPPRL